MPRIHMRPVEAVLVGMEHVFEQNLAELVLDEPLALGCVLPVVEALFLDDLVNISDDSLEEFQQEELRLEVSRVDRAAQDVGGLPEVGFELGQGQVAGQQAWLHCSQVDDGLPLNIAPRDVVR